MANKGSLYIITTDESQISSYGKKFDDNDLESNNHKTHLIKFIFTDRRLCALFDKYSQRDYQNMHDMELIYPLVKFGFTIVLGISDVLLIYLPKKLDLKQKQELNELLSKQNNTNMEVGFSRLSDTDEFIPLESQMTIEQAIDYINNLTSIEVDTKGRTLK